MSPARHLSELNRPDGSVAGSDGGPRAVASDDRFTDRPHEQPASWRFRNWRVRTKIAAILLVPLLAVVTLSGLRLSAVFTDMQQAGRAQQVAGLALRAAALADELQAERDLSGAFLGRGRGYAGQQLHTERDRVDRAIRDYQQTENEIGRSGFGPVVTDLIASVDKHIQQLTQVREGVDRSVAPWTALFGDYSTFISDLISIEEDIPQGSNDARLADGARAMSSLSLVKSLVSAERGSLDYVLGTGKFDDTQFRDFLNTDARLQAAEDQFQGSITAEQRKLYEHTVTGVITSPVSALTQKAMTSTSEALSISLQDWYDQITAMVQKLRIVEVAFGDEVLNRATVLHRNAQRQAAINAGVVLVVLVSTFVLALLVARSLVRPLRRLRSTATEVAHHRLPQSVQRLRSTAAGDLDAEVEQVRISSTDEVGEVATAFNVVHREAVRIAVEQALLRRNVSTMFVNLSRRTQSLVERQLRLIDDLEVNEENTDSLGNLFQLDHLATRMRRNAENLLVLAGADSGRRWNHPVVLIDVLRAAAAEVEQYPRVAQTYVTTREIDGRAVGDVVHLVAEMLENALEFSSPDTQVVVSARSLSGDAGVLIEIEDRGIGMSADELATANDRLVTSAEIDVSLSRMMGLYVVGKLAARHSINVQLRHAATGGVLAQIHLPGSIVADRPDGSDELEAAEQALAMARVAEGPVPVTAGAPPAGQLADLGDHETRPIIVERTRTRPRPLSRTEDDRSRPQAFRDQPGGAGSGDGRDEASGTGPQRGFGTNGMARPDDPAGTGTYRIPSGFPGPASVPGGVSGGAASGGDTASGTSGSRPPDTGSTPQVDLPEFDFGGDIGDMLAGRQPQRESRDTGTQQAVRDTGQNTTQAGLPRRDAAGRIDQQPDLFPAEAAPVAPAAPVEPPATSSARQTPPAPPDPRQAGATAATAATDRAEPAAGTGEEYLPIYAQVESEWFRRRTRPAATAGPATAGAGSTAGAAGPAKPPPRSSWESAADEGWRAAEQIAKPRVSGTTRAGLPIRQPQAHYVPGSAGSRAGGPAAGAARRPGGPGPAPGSPQPQAAGPGAGTPAQGGSRPGSGPVRSPEAVRGLLSNYHRGLRQGREAGHQRGADGDEFRTE